MSVPSYYPSLFERVFASRNLDDLLASSSSAGPAPAAGGGGGGGLFGGDVGSFQWPVEQGRELAGDAEVREAVAAVGGDFDVEDRIAFVRLVILDRQAAVGEGLSGLAGVEGGAGEQVS